MPEWVIVGESSDGTPMVLSEWVMGEKWVEAELARCRSVEFTIFRDRWRAKRQSKRLPRTYAPRAIRLDRL